MQIIKEIEEFQVRRLDNGYTVKVVYSATENGYTGTHYKNFIAPDITAVSEIIKQWCDKKEVADE